MQMHTPASTPQHHDATITTPSSRLLKQQIEQWMASNPKTAPYKAEESLAKLWVTQQDLYSEWKRNQNNKQSDTSRSSPTALLTTESVNLVLEAWIGLGNQIAAERAERLLHWIEGIQDSLDLSLLPFLPRPDYQSYAAVIDAWSRAAVYESTYPGIETFQTHSGSGEGKGMNKVSRATKAGFECAKRAEDALMHMQKMHENQLPSVHYNSEIQPDTRVFNLVLNAWSKIRGGTKASAIRALRILDLMQELYHYQSMHVHDWQGILLSKVQPNLQSYKHVLHAWANASHTLEGPDRAEEILRHMLSLSKAGNVGAEIIPDAECFHIVMRSHAELIRKKRKSDDYSVERPQKVTSLLDWMELLALRRITSKIQPTTESYRIALSAWAWSHHVLAPKEAESVLYRMIRACDLHIPKVRGNSDSRAVRPETIDFNTVINCCSFARKVGAEMSREDDNSLLARQLAHYEIFEIADGVFNTILNSPHAKPDSATFAGIIRASLNLLPNTYDRDERVINYFRIAYNTPPPTKIPHGKIYSMTSERMRAPPGAGCVDANVLRQLRHALPSTEDYIRVREEFEEYRRRNTGEI